MKISWLSVEKSITYGKTAASLKDIDQYQWNRPKDKHGPYIHVYLYHFKPPNIPANIMIEAKVENYPYGLVLYLINIPFSLFMSDIL